MKLTYLIDPETNLVWSRYENELAIPVLEYDKMNENNNFATSYHLEKFSVIEAYKVLGSCKAIKNIPKTLKNEHRKFWNMKELK